MKIKDYEFLKNLPMLKSHEVTSYMENEDVTYPELYYSAVSRLIKDTNRRKFLLQYIMERYMDETWGTLLK